MPPPSNRASLIQHMLEALETPSKDLTKWEENFIGSIQEQFTARGTLSDRQVEILDRIYTEHTE